MVHVGTQRLACHDWGGDGPPVLLAHATGLHGLVWRPVAERLVDSGRHVWSFDFRGHGDSGRSAEGYAWDRFADDVIGVLAARNTGLLFFRDEMRKACDEVRVWTDDGSEGKKGLATDAIREIQAEGPIAEVIAIGPVPMMKFVSKLTRELGIPTQVSLNPVMVDGTGMCGGCRVTVGGKAKFVCVDGPEFDGHLVDFDELSRRQAIYKEDERHAMERLQKEVR